jgi:PhoD-like phosphatase
MTLPELYNQPHIAVRKHAGPKLRTLGDYRIRHAQYKTDPHLQAAHARCPWVMTWDDREFENNYANDISEKAGVDPVEFLEQRANAYQAYYEAMPLRPRAVPQGPHMKLYRTIPYGRLATFRVLDTRQYHTDQPNGDDVSELNDDALNPKNTILGAKQANWMKSALLRSTGTWNVLAQQVMMGMARQSWRKGQSPRLCNGPVAWIRGRVDAARPVPRRPAGAQPGCTHRRHPLELGQQPAGRRPQAGTASLSHLAVDAASVVRGLMVSVAAAGALNYFTSRPQALPAAARHDPRSIRSRCFLTLTPRDPEICRRFASLAQLFFWLLSGV